MGDEKIESGEHSSPSYPEPGNYYIYKGTWVRDTLLDRVGVVANRPKDNTNVNILWRPNGSEHLSPRSLRSKLRRGRYEIDPDQHPYDKVEWKTGRGVPV